MSLVSKVILGVKSTYRTVREMSRRELPSEVRTFIDMNKKRATTGMQGTEIHKPVPYSSLKTNAGKFYKAVLTNKLSLMKDLNIDEKTYDMLSSIALSISREESSYGRSGKFFIFNNLEKSNIFTKILSFIRNYKKGDGTLSIGMTQLKIDKVSDTEKELLTKYGITFGKNRSNITNPENSALATIIHLNELLKGYPEYLKSARTLKPDMADIRVISAIERAKAIIRDDTKRPLAIGALRAHQGTLAEKMALKKAGLTLEDLDALRTYASTIELSERAYLAASWNGRMIIPQGPRGDLAYINLIHADCEKGYISNILRTSRVYA